jgi:Transcription termination factor nusG
MGTWCESNWYVVQTKRAREYIAAAYIGRLGLDVFLPMVKQEKGTIGGSRAGEKPLFPEYLFARISREEHFGLMGYQARVLIEERNVGRITPAA